MTEAPYQAILFDLGGVLVDFDGITPLVSLSANAFDRETARQFWLSSPWVQRFETGRCTATEFAVGVIADLALPIEAGQFLAEFTSWERGPMAGALSLLDSLRARFILACLSNNNELHWRRLRDEMGLAQRFNRCYLSHEIGVMKPHREAFDFVLRDLGISADRIIFLDDNLECVEAAARVGLTARQARGVDEVKRALSFLGVACEVKLPNKSRWR